MFWWSMSRIISDDLYRAAANLHPQSMCICFSAFPRGFPARAVLAGMEQLSRVDATVQVPRSTCLGNCMILVGNPICQNQLKQ